MPEAINSLKIDIVIPVLNEEEQLARSVETLRSFLSRNVPYQWNIVVADNGSTDRTLAIARELSGKYPDTRYVHLDQRGRGRALRKTWLESKADIVSYMDVDLSTNLEAFPKLIEALRNGYDIAIGSRLMKGARTTRSFKRELTSRIYNLMIKAMFFTTFNDAQCGFKAVKKSVVEKIVPMIENQAWFFDSELLILAHRKGYKIKEVPVEWLEDPGTTVNVVKTAREDISGLLRLRFKRIK